MPPPGEPYIPSLAADLSADEVANADADYLYFLQHVHLDGSAYTVVIPSEDGADPPQIIRYERPLPDHNAGNPDAGSEYGGQGVPPPSKEDSRTTSEAPHGVKRKTPDACPGGEFRAASTPIEEDTPTPVEEPAWYDSPDMDEDYRFFLRHTSLEKGKLVFRTGNHSVTIGDVSDAEEVEDTVEEEGEGEEDGEEEAIPASGQSGEDGNDTEEDVVTDKEDGVGSDLTIVMVKDEEVSEEKEHGVEEKSEEREEDAVGKDVGPRSDLQIVNDLVLESEGQAEEEGEKPLNALIKGPTDLDPLDKKEASSSKEPQGVIWPPHIKERPNSVFKEKLIEFLSKSFNQEEYDRYFALATDRTPMVKERRTRNSVAYYPWMYEMGKSYFDRYPDLAEQVRLQCNNYPNALALLRGFFFWLQKVGQEDQFRPWSDEFKRYRVVEFNG